MNMDNLAKDAKAASMSGMSYGKWKALHPETKEKPQEIPEGMAACEHCGKLFKKTHLKRFCDIECRNAAYSDRKRAIDAESRARRKEKRCVIT